MIQYSGRDYLFISIANTFGLDKLTFEQRIEWVEENEHNLEEMVAVAEEPILFGKAIDTLNQAKQGIPTGYMCALDAVCSGAQIMSAISGCMAGAKATGLVDPDRRADAYTDLNKVMENILEEGLNHSRSDLKQAFMTLN